MRRKIVFVACALLIATAVALWLLANPTPPPPAPVTQSVTLPTSTPPALDSTSTQILELFSPSDAMLTGQLNRTGIEQRIEQIMLTAFVLARCGLMENTQYRDTYRALIAYTLESGLVSTTTAAETEVKRLSESASASYSFVYHRTRCDDPTLGKIADQLAAWRAHYL